MDSPRAVPTTAGNLVRLAPVVRSVSDWAYVVKLDAKTDGITWQRFFDKIAKQGGDGFYGAWSLAHLEPVFQDDNLR
jgi:hypothetical protein